LIKSAAFSPIMMVGALVLPPIRIGDHSECTDLLRPQLAVAAHSQSAAHRAAPVR
jgi:hypothetical protein